MRAAALLPAHWGFDAFGMAVGLAWVAGGLSIVVPAFQPLVAVLAAIALAGAAAADAQRPSKLPRNRSSMAFAVGALGFAALIWLSAPPDLAAGRGLILGAGLLPLWWSVRSQTRRPLASGGVA